MDAQSPDLGGVFLLESFRYSLCRAEHIVVRERVHEITVCNEHALHTNIFFLSSAQSLTQARVNGEIALIFEVHLPITIRCGYRESECNTATATYAIIIKYCFKRERRLERH